MERSVKKRVVAFQRLLGRRGLARDEAARFLRLSVPTLKRWEHSWRVDKLRPQLRGRPPRRADVATRNLLIASLRTLGPLGSLRVLWPLFPEVARREVADLSRRYRRVCGRRHIRHELNWNGPGRVWSMDLTFPHTPVDGIHPGVLIVHDLGADYQVAAVPVPARDTQTIQAALRPILEEHGPPLIMKSDNEGAFRAAEEFLHQAGTLLLLSPPRTPRYNGSCEATIGQTKKRIEFQARQAGRPGQWNSADVEAARKLRNALIRPWGPLGPTPEAVWSTRQPIGSTERSRFQETVGRHRTAEQKRRQLTEKDRPGHRVRASVDRAAIPRALIELGYLQIRRR